MVKATHRISDSLGLCTAGGALSQLIPEHCSHSAGKQLGVLSFHTVGQNFRAGLLSKRPCSLARKASLYFTYMSCFSLALIVNRSFCRKRSNMKAVRLRQVNSDGEMHPALPRKSASSEKTSHSSASPVCADLLPQIDWQHPEEVLVVLTLALLPQQGR